MLTEYDVNRSEFPDTQPRSEPALEQHRRPSSSVGITSPFQWSQHRKQFQRKADNNKKGLKWKS